MTLVFFEKNRSFSYISMFYFTLDMSLISWCIIYDTQFIFFPKIEKVTLRNQFNSLIFFLGSKLNFLVDFIKNKKCKK